MGTNVVVCAGPNHFGTRFSKWAATSQYSASFPDDNLALSRPSKPWRSLNQNPFNCVAYGLHNAGLDFFNGAYADACALVSHNLRQGSGRWRVRLWDINMISDPPPVPSYIAPTGSAGASNTTSDHTQVDDDLSTDADDGNEATATNPALAWTIRYTFPTPGTTPIQGSSSDRRQAFIVKVRNLTADADPGNGRVSVKATLYQSGASVRNLGTKIVSKGGSNYQFFIYPWDMSELADPTGASVEVRLDMTPFGGVSIGVKACGWMFEDDTFDDMNIFTGLIADSGWMDAVDDVTANTPFGVFYPTKVHRAETSFHRFEDVGYGGPGSGLERKVRAMQFLAMDDQTPTGEDGVAIGRTPVAVDGYVQVGTAWMSQGLELTVNRELGDLVTVDDRSIRTETYGGNLGGAKLPRRRIVSVPLEWCTEAEGMALLDRLAWEGSILDPVVVSLRPTNTTERRHTTIYGVLMDPQTVLRAVNNGAVYNRGLTLRFLEWR